MAEILLQPQPLNLEPQKTVDTKNIKVNTGGQSFIVDAQQGMYLGAEEFDDAPFSVGFDGTLKAEAGVFSGKIEIKDGSGNVVILIDPNASS